MGARKCFDEELAERMKAFEASLLFDANSVEELEGQQADLAQFMGRASITTHHKIVHDESPFARERGV